MRGLTRAFGLVLLLGVQPEGADPGAPYLRGEGAEVRLGNGPAVLPATRFACAGRHGNDGRGRRKGGTDFPSLKWPRLTERGFGDGVRLVSLREDLVRPALVANLPPGACRPYLVALLLAEALLRCGRDVTQACAFDRLEEIDVAPFLSVYGRAEDR